MTTAAGIDEVRGEGEEDYERDKTFCVLLITSVSGVLHHIRALVSQIYSQR